MHADNIPVQVSGTIWEWELKTLAAARRVCELPPGDRDAYFAYLRETYPDYEGDPWPGMTGTLRSLTRELTRIIDRLIIPPAGGPRPCSRYPYPHTAHRDCPGQAPEFPVERVYVVTAHDDAADAYNDAERAYHQAKTGAAAMIEDAGRELDRADEALRATESAPGIPLPVPGE